MSKPPAKKISVFQILGWLLIAAAVVILFARADVKDDSIGLIIFVALFVLGIMLTLGLIGSPAGFAARKKAIQEELQRRSQNRATSSVSNPKTADLVPCVYTYPSPLIARIFLWFLAVLMLALGVGGFIGAIIMGSIGLALFFIAIGLFGVSFFGWYAIRIPRIRFEISPQGLNVARLFGSVRITWPEIIMLRKMDSPAGTSGFIASGSIYRIYSLNGNAEFYQSLTGAKELAKTIEQVTGMEWE
jgi:hypothetical protein